MVFVGEVEELALDSSKLGSGEGLEALFFRDTIVLAAMNDENRCIPCLHFLYRVELGNGLLSYGIAFIPIISSELMSVEENLFSSAVHTLGIEYPAVRDKGLKTVVVDTSQIIYRMAAK